VLQNYLEGTWTPVITGSGANPTFSYVTRSGSYTRIGNRIYVEFYLDWTSATGGSGDLRVSLPVTAATGPAGRVFVGAVNTSNIAFTVSATYTVFVNSGDNYAVIRGFRDTGSIAVLPCAPGNINFSAFIYGSVCYIV